MNILIRFWQKRFVRVLVWIAGSLVTIYLLFCAWINYAGARRWTAAQEMLRREGESLDFRMAAIDPVPDERNFCAIPALKDIALAPDHDVEKGEFAAKRKRLDEASLPAGNGAAASKRPRHGLGATVGEAADLKAWAAWLRAEGSLPMPADSGNPARDVLAALSKHDVLFAELASGLNRTEAQWTPSWKSRELPETLFEIRLPHYQVTQHVVATLTLRATAAARAGDAARAHESLLIALRLARATLSDPMLISTLVACAQSTQACGAVWELCEARAGSAEDFRRLEQELAKLDFRAGLLQGFRGELAAGTGAVRWLKKTRDAKMIAALGNASYDPSASWPEVLLIKCIPGGWFDMNAATMVEMEFGGIIKPLRDEGLRRSSRNADAFESDLKQRKGRLQFDSIFACLLMPAVLQVEKRAAYTLCLVQEAVAACALERYRMEHNAYPDTLDAVRMADGKALPPDALTGKPMGYRKTPDGRYALWCAGFDGKDDGGKRVLDAEKPQNTKFSDASYAGDWVWDYPVK